MTHFIKKLIVAPLAILAFSFSILAWLIPFKFMVTSANFCDNIREELTLWAMRVKMTQDEVNAYQRKILKAGNRAQERKAKKKRKGHR